VSDAVTSPARKRTRAVSRALFGGAQYRVEVGAAIAASDGLVCITDLVAELGDPPGKGSVSTELKVLERAGLLSPLNAVQGERRRFLRREPSVYWSFCEEVKSRCNDVD
jgi:DNA-binding transcriptional regulator GbsR (MarR family)